MACPPVGRRSHEIPGESGRLERVPSWQADYSAFLCVLSQAQTRVPMRLLSFSVMPNHWHLVLRPESDDDLSRFMQWLTRTHAPRWQVKRRSVGTGAVYQGRFRAIPVQSDEHLLTVCRYVERNPLRAGLVDRVEHWRWSSAWRESGLGPRASGCRRPVNLRACEHGRN
jgi:putative transposase